MTNLKLLPKQPVWTITAIARALMARDQRAAEIALAHGENSLDGQYWAGVNQAAVSISNAILSYDEDQK